MISAISGYNDELFTYWDMTRRIMWAAGQWESGTTPSALIPLPIDNKRLPSKEEVENIRQLFNQ